MHADLRGNLLQRLGFGARLCIVLSGALLLWTVWVYQSDFRYWQKYEHCTHLPEPPSRPIGFDIVDARKQPIPPAQGNQHYKICFQNPPITSNAASSVGCTLLLAKNDGDLSPVIIEGPANASVKSIEEAANRLGLVGDLTKILADAGARTEITEPKLKADYERCSNQYPYYVRPVKRPTFDSESLLTALAWIWGIYGVVRFLRGK